MGQVFFFTKEISRLPWGIIRRGGNPRSETLVLLPLSRALRPERTTPLPLLPLMLLVFGNKPAIHAQ